MIVDGGLERASPLESIALHECANIISHMPCICHVATPAETSGGFVPSRPLPASLFDKTCEVGDGSRSSVSAWAPELSSPTRKGYASTSLQHESAVQSPERRQHRQRDVTQRTLDTVSVELLACLLALNAIKALSKKSSHEFGMRMR